MPSQSTNRCKECHYNLLNHKLMSNKDKTPLPKSRRLLTRLLTQFTSQMSHLHQSIPLPRLSLPQSKTINLTPLLSQLKPRPPQPSLPQLNLLSPPQLETQPHQETPPPQPQLMRPKTTPSQLQLPPQLSQSPRPRRKRLSLSQLSPSHQMLAMEETQLPTECAELPEIDRRSQETPQRMLCHTTNPTSSQRRRPMTSNHSWPDHSNGTITTSPHPVSSGRKLPERD